MPAPSAAPDDPFCRQLDTAWKAELARRHLYVNDIFLTLVRRPLPGGAGLLDKVAKRPGKSDAASEFEQRQLHATNFPLTRRC